METQTIQIHDVDFERVVDAFVSVYRPSYEYINTNGTVRTYITEQYYFRVKSDLSITVIFDFIRQEVNIIVSGGSSGLLGVTWGAERNMLKKLVDFFTT
ncbi:MAG: hypothetical protein JW891_11985 [Candidatus Lokiarchaeota archaeon]|nr:hypothetical protein [Candidatus Lokiarchaeota archaeon]